MKYDSNKHNRRSIRLTDYDYSQSGAYFVTVCTRDRACVLGEISDGQVRLNALGEVVTKWWLKLREKFPLVETDACVVMPNHVHGIIRIVGADPCVRPDVRMCVGAQNAQGARMGAPLPRIVQWFKTMTTNQYLKMTKDPAWASISGRLWQRNYYEHVIRSEESLNAIREYIQANPFHWKDDPDNPEAFR